MSRTEIISLAHNKSTNVRTLRRPSVPRGYRLLERLAPALAARLALRWFVRPRRLARPDRERAVLAAGAPLPLSVRGARLAAWEWGRGPAVLLVHGWEGRGSQLGSLVAPLVDAGFRVVAFDGPAHGDSPGRQLTLIDFAAVIEEVVDAVGPVAAVVAHSFGAASTTLALSRGASIGRVVYLAPATRVETAISGFATLLDLGGETIARFRRLLEGRAGVPLQKVDGIALAPALTTPLLILHDEEDRDVPLLDAERLARVWPGAELRRTTGLGHRRILSDPDTIDRVVDFVSRTAVGREADVAESEALDRELFDREARRRRAFP